MTEYNGKPYLVTGGNDDCVAIWDLAGVFDSKASISRASNGKFRAVEFVVANPESHQSSLFNPLDDSSPTELFHQIQSTRRTAVKEPLG